jgi:hypothetical protein
MNRYMGRPLRAASKLRACLSFTSIICTQRRPDLPTLQHFAARIKPDSGSKCFAYRQHACCQHKSPLPHSAQRIAVQYQEQCSCMATHTDPADMSQMLD